MLAITISGFLGGLSGAVAAQQIGYLTPDGVFNLTVPLFVIVMSVLGGRRHWLGPVIGAVLVYSLQERLATSGYDEWGQVVLGAILVLVILFVPEGIYERLRSRPRRALIAGAALVAGIVVAWLAEWGAATDWLATGLAAATAVLLVSRPKRPKHRAEERSDLAASPAEEAVVR
jgi:branched-chain amino acid transport system permease protein